MKTSPQGSTITFGFSSGISSKISVLGPSFSRWASHLASTSASANDEILISTGASDKAA